MKKMKKTLLVITAAIFLLLPSLVFADGAIFPQPGYWITEVEQKAVIVYDDNVETLILSITFKGDPKNFAWVIPVPNQPTVDKAPDELFTALKELTRYQEPIYRPLGLMKGVLEAPEAAKTVTVLETKKVDIYDITILESTDAKALAKWLKENGYKYPEKASYILDEYIQNKWYFVAVKINPEKILGAEGKLASGHATPIKIVFNSDKIIYPLKISSLMSPEINKECTSNKDCKDLICTQVVGQDTPCCVNGRCICGPKDCNFPVPLEKKEIESKADVTTRVYPYWDNRYSSVMLYIFADHKKTVPGFETFYANWIKPDKIKKLAYDLSGKPWYEANKTFYLTKLYRSMLFSEMAEDLILRDAEDNTPVGIGMLVWQKILLIILYALLFLMIWIISPSGLGFIILAVVQFIVKNKIARIIFWILQSFLLAFSLIITLLLGITYFFGSFLQSYYYPNIASILLTSKINLLAAFCSSVFVVVAMMAVMITQGIWQRKRRKSTIK